MPDVIHEVPRPVTFRVKDWDALYENNRTRDLKSLLWVPIPNRMDGDGYTELVDHQNGAAHLGAWLATVQVASRCVPRGTLMRDDGRPHTPQSLARMSRLPAVVFAEALPRFLQIGWLVTLTAEGDTAIPRKSAEIPHQRAAESQSTALASHPTAQEGKKETQEGREEKRLNDAFYSFIDQYPNQIGLDEACRQWISLVSIGEITESNLPEVLAGLERWNTSEQWATEGGKYVPSPAKWLRDRRWKDSPKPVETYQPPPASSEGVNPLAEWIPRWKRKKPEEDAA